MLFFLKDNKKEFILWLNVPKVTAYQQHNHENELKNKEIGWLGKFFGAEDNAARNMAMTVIILVSGGATVFSVCVILKSNIGDDLIPNVWSKVSPVITLALGYIFGKNKG